MSDLAKTYLRQARSFLRVGDPQKAAELLDRARLLSEHDSRIERQVLEDMSAAYAAAGRPEQAARCRQRLEAMFPAVVSAGYSTDLLPTSLPPLPRPTPVEAPGPPEMIRYTGYVPAHDEIEEKLAAALVPLDLGTAASAAQGEKVTRPAERPPGEAARPRVKVKLHILALLTVVTVIPLGLLMIWLPLYEVMPGNDQEQGTMAWNLRNNQEAVRAAILSIFGVKPNDQTENPQIKSNQVQPAAGEQHLRCASLVCYGPKGSIDENPARRIIPL